MEEDWETWEVLEEEEELNVCLCSPSFSSATSQQKIEVCEFWLKSERDDLTSSSRQFCLGIINTFTPKNDNFDQKLQYRHDLPFTGPTLYPPTFLPNIRRW